VRQDGGMEARHLRGRARSYGQCRGVSGAHPDGGLANSRPQGINRVVHGATWAKYMRAHCRNPLAQDSVSEGHPNRASQP
jgi:hypothetical protein